MHQSLLGSSSGIEVSPRGTGGCEEGLDAGRFFLVDRPGGMTKSREDDRGLRGAEKETNENNIQLVPGSKAVSSGRNSSKKTRRFTSTTTSNHIFVENFTRNANVHYIERKTRDSEINLSELKLTLPILSHQ